MTSKSGETMYKTKEKETKPKPKPKASKKGKEPKPEEEEIMKEIEEGSTKTSQHSRPRLSSRVQNKMETIFKAINDFGQRKGLSIAEINKIHESAYYQVVNAREAHRISSEKQANIILRNISNNEQTATNYLKLLYNVDAPENISPSDVDIAGYISESTPSYMSVPTEARDMQVDRDPKEEPKLSPSQLQHIEGVVKILEKDPKLKNDIKRTITEELTKGYINPDQFKHYNQELERITIEKEVPEAIRGKRKAKPRAKKSAQADTPIIPMDIEQPSKLPKGKNKKDTQKKKPKIVTL